MNIRYYQLMFKRVLDHLEIPYRNFHQIRHSFATYALELGMDVKTLSEILGHKTPIITLNRYAHSLEEHKFKQMDLLGKMFDNNSKDIA